MSKKLSGNGLWESSRMMLPQHKEAIFTYHEKRDEHYKPSVDSQEQEEIDRILIYSLQKKRPLDISFYNTKGSYRVMGVVKNIDVHRKRIKINDQNNTVWIKFEEIISVNM